LRTTTSDIRTVQQAFGSCSCPRFCDPARSGGRVKAAFQSLSLPPTILPSPSPPHPPHPKASPHHPGILTAAAILFFCYLLLAALRPRGGSVGRGCWQASHHIRWEGGPRGRRPRIIFPAGCSDGLPPAAAPAAAPTAAPAAAPIPIPPPPPAAAVAGACWGEGREGARGRDRDDDEEAAAAKVWRDGGGGGGGGGPCFACPPLCDQPSP
jgi:hypothetical protein